jgi:hypothetical protein
LRRVATHPVLQRSELLKAFLELSDSVFFHTFLIFVLVPLAFVFNQNVYVERVNLFSLFTFKSIPFNPLECFFQEFAQYKEGPKKEKKGLMASLSDKVRNEIHLYVVKCI